MSPQGVVYDVQNGSAREGAKIKEVGSELPVKSFFGHVSIGTVYLVKRKRACHVSRVIKEGPDDGYAR
jgi:hypothetical protein